MEDKGGAPGLLLEALTRRELNILAHFASGKSSKEIAALETLSYGSVKWYIHQVYGKLGVGNRNEAITRARELGLLKITAPVPEAKTALAPAPGTKHNLPHQLTSFIGRKKELSKLHGLLTGETARLVTLTGPGGTGKTRLALKAAEELLEDFPDGIYLVELAPLSDPRLVLGAIAGALGLRQSPDTSIQEAVAGYLDYKRLLLILDNCEHLIEECARVAGYLLGGSPGLRILATSREILGVNGEIPLNVPPLEQPNVRPLPGLEVLGQVEAVRLFVERAQQAMPEYTIDEGNAAGVAQISRRLDGIPLALELAAARLRMMTVQQVASRLDNVFHLLTGGSRSALPRQQTLKATMDWSYTLLSTQEKLAFQRLSVFAGSWTLEGAEVVCAGDGLGADEVLDVLGRLVDKSLVFLTHVRDGEARYRMLETVRRYARDKLLESIEGEAVSNRHLDYFLQFALKAGPHLRGQDEMIWMDQVEEEMPNLRLALEWSLTGRVVDGMELASSLFWFWHIRSFSQEAIDWHEKLLSAEEAMPSPSGTQVDSKVFAARRLARARALRIALTSEVHQFKSAPGKNHAWLKESVAICRELGPAVKHDLAISLRCLGASWLDEHSLEALQESLALARQAGDPFTTADCLWSIGEGAPVSHTEQMQFLQESLDIARQVNYTFRIADCLWTIGRFCESEGDLERARAYQEECLSMRKKLRDITGTRLSLFILGYLAFLQGDYSKAEALLTESLAIAKDENSLLAQAGTTFELSRLARARGENPKSTDWGSKALAFFIEIDGKPYNLKINRVLAICNLGLTAWADGDDELATRRGAEALGLAQEAGVSSEAAHYLLAVATLSRGDLAQAEMHLKPLLPGKTNTIMVLTIGGGQNPIDIAARLRLAGLLASARGQMERAATLFGAIHDWEARTPGYYCPKERCEYETALGKVRAELGESGFTAAWQAGHALTLEQVVEATRLE